MQQLSNLDFNNAARIVNLLPSAAAGQPVIHEQLNAAIEAISWKDDARVKTVGNLNLAAPGASVDGVAMAAGDRILVGSQTVTTENGIYIWNAAGTPATRSADASTGDELESAVITISEGTSAGTTWRQNQVNFVIGVGSPTFVSFGTGSPAASEVTAGIAEIATQAETDTGTDDARMVTPLKLATSPWARKGFSVLIGDGAATSYVVTHNLNSRNVAVVVSRNSGAFDEVGCDIANTTVNTCTITFAVAPTLNQFNVAVSRMV